MAKPPVVQLAANLWRIPTAPASFVNSFAFVEDDGSVTLVDTGVKKAPPKIVAGCSLPRVLRSNATSATRNKLAISMPPTGGIIGQCSIFDRRAIGVTHSDSVASSISRL